MKKKIYVTTAALLASSLIPAYIATAEQSEAVPSQPDLRSHYDIDNYELPLLKAYFQNHVEAFSENFTASIHLSYSTHEEYLRIIEESKKIQEEAENNIFGTGVNSYPIIGSYTYHMLMPRFQQGGSTINMSAQSYATLKYKFSLKYRHTFEDEQLLTQKIKEIAKSLISENASDLDKVIAVHHYVSENFQNPSSSSTGDLNSPYAMFKTGQGEAIASSLLAHRLLEALNIEVFTIRGSRYADVTAWNLVKVDGEWYNSVVYADRILTHTYVPWQQTSYSHLLLSDAELAKIQKPKDNNELRAEQYVQLPAATSTKYDKLLKNSNVDYDINNYTEDSMADAKYIYLNQPNYSVAIYDKQTLKEVTIDGLDYFANPIRTKDRVYFFNREGFATFDIASNKVIVLQTGSFNNYAYKNQVVKFTSLDEKQSFEFDLADTEKMNALILQYAVSDEKKLQTLLTNLKNIQPFTNSYREDAKNLFNAMHALPSHLTITEAQRKEIENHYYRSSMNFESHLGGFQQGPYEIWKNSYNNPIHLKGNTNTIKLRLTHDVYSYENYSPIMIYNEYGEQVNTSANFKQKTVEIKASEDFIKGRPYYVVVRSELLGKKENTYDSIGRNVIITFIVE